MPARLCPGEIPLPGCKLLTSHMSSHGEKQREESVFVTLLSALYSIPLILISTNPNYLLKAPPPNTITLWGRVSTQEFGGTFSS